MDDSIFNPSQTEMITFTTPAANFNDQPVTYGPVLYDVLAEVGKRIGGAQYLIGIVIQKINKFTSLTMLNRCLPNPTR